MDHPRSAVALFAPILFMGVVNAQWGVRAGMAGEMFGEPLVGEWVLGVDRDVSGRSSIGMDLLWRFDLRGGLLVQNVADHGGLTYYYELDQGVRGVQFRSTYFLSNDVSGVYVGSYIGYRSVVRHLRNVLVSHPNFTSERYDDRTLNNAVFPFGVRIGLRGALDGFFQDLYVGLGYVAGHGADELVEQAPYVPERHRLGGLHLQFGYCFGVGW